MQTQFDHHETVMHGIVAEMRFPGPDHYEVLKWLHEEIRPESYVEIGIFRGQSLKLARPPTIALGIDPFPEVDGQWAAQTSVATTTSSEFFAKHSLGEFFPSNHFSLAFVDGLHHFDQAIEDIYSLETFAQPDSLIAVHDTIPLNEKTALRDRVTSFYTGDVWKVVPFLKRFRPDLVMVTVRSGPSGLTLIGRLNPAHKRSGAHAESLKEFRDLSWSYYKQYGAEFLETIPNTLEAVAGWLARLTRDR